MKDWLEVRDHPSNMGIENDEKRAGFRLVEEIVMSLETFGDLVRLIHFKVGVNNQIKIVKIKMCILHPMKCKEFWKVPHYFKCTCMNNLDTSLTFM